MALDTTPLNISIRRSHSLEETRRCAQMMADSDPWATLGIDFETALRLADNPDLERYAALEKDKLVGFIWLNMSHFFKAYVEDLCVADSRQNLGIGSLLLEHVEKRVFQENDSIYLCVSSFNNRAQKLYMRRGYELVGVLKDFIVRGHSEFVMCKAKESA